MFKEYLSRSILITVLITISLWLLWPTFITYTFENDENNNNDTYDVFYGDIKHYFPFARPI